MILNHSILDAHLIVQKVVSVRAIRILMDITHNGREVDERSRVWIVSEGDGWRTQKGLSWRDQFHWIERGVGDEEEKKKWRKKEKQQKKINRCKSRSWAESKVLVLHGFVSHWSWWLTKKGTELSCQYNWLSIFISMKVHTQKPAVDILLNRLSFDWGPVHLFLQLNRCSSDKKGNPWRILC